MVRLQIIINLKVIGIIRLELVRLQYFGVQVPRLRFRMVSIAVFSWRVRVGV